MSRTHEVVQGECLSTIAARYGFANWREIYDHPDNEAFRVERPDPNVIHPGDELQIPAVKTKSVGKGTDAIHRLRISRPRVRLKLKVVDDIEHLEASGLNYSLEVDGLKAPLCGEVGPGGLVDVAIPLDARRATLTVLDEDDDEVYDEYELEIGALDPLESTRGVQQRLDHMGFLCGPLDGHDGPRTQAAVCAFQAAYTLDVDGIVGPKTREKLQEIYGC